MKKTRYAEEQVAFALRQAETGTPVAEAIGQMCMGAEHHSSGQRPMSGSNSGFRSADLYAPIGVGAPFNESQMAFTDDGIAQCVWFPL